MVSKITKKSPKTPTIPRHRRHRKTPSPSKSVSLSTSLHHSLRSARRKLLSLFSHFVISPKSHRGRGFTRLTTPLPNPPLIPILPPPPIHFKKTLFLDLDETLVHSQTDPLLPENKYDFIVHPKIDNHIVPFYVLKRPGVDNFLKNAAAKFEVIVFTAGLREYASLVLDELDPEGKVIAHRLYRDSCREVEGRFVKDLERVGRELGRVAIVDDNPGSYVLQRENGVPIKAFVSDMGDRELERVGEFLEVAARVDDMRDAVRVFLEGGIRRFDVGYFGNLFVEGNE